MVRRLPFIARVAQVVFAAWLAALMAEPLAMHVCPMHAVHTAGASAGASHGAGASASVGHAGHVATAHAEGTEAPGHPGGSDGEGNPSCMCLGSACTSAAAAVAPASITFVAHALVAVADQPAFTAFGPPCDAARRLPFATGPPARSV